MWKWLQSANAWLKPFFARLNWLFEKLFAIIEGIAGHFFLIIFIFAISGAIYWAILIESDPIRFWWFWKHNHDILRNLSIGIAGLLGGLAGLYTLYNATRRTEAQRRSGDVDDRREVHERFARAIELLGEESPVVRLGSIYVLEQLAEEGSSSRASATDILSAFVRNQRLRDQNSASINDVMGAVIGDDVKGAVFALARLSNGVP